MLIIVMMILGFAFPVPAQPSGGKWIKEYSFRTRVSAANLVNVIAPANVTVRAVLLADGKVIGATGRFDLHPESVSRDIWGSEIAMRAPAMRGVYVQLVVSGAAYYRDGTRLWLRGSTLAITGIDERIDFGVLPLTVSSRYPF
jgi:hypothetical protein